MHFDDVSCLLSNHIIQLTGEVLGGETEVLSEYNVSENVFSVAPLYPILVLSGQIFVNTSWLEQYNLVKVV